MLNDYILMLFQTKKGKIYYSKSNNDDLSFAKAIATLADNPDSKVNQYLSILHFEKKIFTKKNVFSYIIILGFNSICHI